MENERIEGLREPCCILSMAIVELYTKKGDFTIYKLYLSFKKCEKINSAERLFLNLVQRSLFKLVTPFANNVSTPICLVTSFFPSPLD